MFTDLVLFITGGILVIIALLADLSRSRVVRTVPIPQRASRAILCVVGIALASIPFLPSATTTPAPAAAPVATARVVTPTRAPATSSPAPQPEPASSAQEKAPTQPNLPMTATDQAVVKDAGQIKVTQRQVTVSELPDSVVREILKRHPVPVEPDFAKVKPRPAEGQTSDEGTGN